MNIKKILKKPKKKLELEFKKCDSEYEYGWNNGYVKACEDWEKFLPSKDEMRIIIEKHFKKVKIISNEWVRTQIALAISKRIGKKR